MFDLFKHSRDKQQPPARDRTSSLDNPSSRPSVAGTPSQPSHSATFQDLVRIALRNTLRVNGIPADWVSCEVLPSQQPAAKPPVHHISLVIHKWHEALPQYLPLLQLQLAQNMQRFDPTSDHSVHMMTWRFAPDCVSPHTSMPPPTFWSRPTAKPKFDLPSAPREQWEKRHDFAPTEPSPLR